MRSSLARARKAPPKRRLSPEQPGLRDEGRSEPACLGLSCGTSSPAIPATANNEECQETAAAETTATGAQGIPSLRALRPSCRRQWASTDGGLMQHMEQKHGSQVLLEDSVGQLRWLNRQARVHCGTLGSQRRRRCNSCGSDTPTLSRTDDSPGIKTQRPAVRHAVSNPLRARQYLQENLWTTGAGAGRMCSLLKLVLFASSRTLSRR